MLEHPVHFFPLLFFYQYQSSTIYSTTNKWLYFVITDMKRCVYFYLPFPLQSYFTKSIVSICHWNGADRWEWSRWLQMLDNGPKLPSIVVSENHCLIQLNLSSRLCLTPCFPFLLHWTHLFIYDFWLIWKKTTFTYFVLLTHCSLLISSFFPHIYAYNFINK